jgi:peptidylprolyl isomerase
MMRKYGLYTLTTSAMLLASSCGYSDETAQKKEDTTTKEQVGATKTETKPETEIDIKKVSEAFGNFIGRNIKSSGLDIDIEQLVKGIRNGSEGKPSPLNDKEYERQIMALQEKGHKELSDKNLKEATEFLKENAKKTGVVTVVPEKLQYTILQEGKGDVVAEHSTPLVQYTGKYIDGTTFGSSEETGGPITIPLDQTIPGFSKGIVGMKEGEKRRLFISPDLGYGTTGHLPPNSLLIFDVEVVKASSPKATSLLDSQDIDSVADGDDDEDEDEEESSEGETGKDETKKEDNKDSK